MPAPTRFTRLAPALVATVALCALGCGGGEATGETETPSPTSGDGVAGGAGALSFEDVTDASGIDFVHDTGASGGYFMPEIMGGGAAWLDADGDGDLDLYLTNGVGPDRLYVQQTPGRFEDGTAAAGIPARDAESYGMGVAVGDVDADGDLDLYLTNHGRDRLLRNVGGGRFEDATEALGIAVDGWSSSATFCDVDRDGDLDLYVARYVRYEPERRCTDEAGRPDYCSPAVFRDDADVLLRNDGTRFTDVSDRAGLGERRGSGLGVACVDLFGDGAPEIFVANDGDANHLWVRKPDGTYRDEALARGLAYNAEGAAEAGMGVAVADFDLDGRLDLFLTHLDGETHTLYGQRDDGTFDDHTAASDLAETTLAATGFGTAEVLTRGTGAGEALSGRPAVPGLVVAHGRVTRVLGAPLGDGSTWEETYGQANRAYVVGHGADADAAFTTPREVSRGLAAGDYDGDGDRDVVVVNAGGRARLYRRSSPGLAIVSVRLRDANAGHDAIGARATLADGDETFVRVVHRGASYVSSHDATVHFDVPSGDAPRTIDVRWADGTGERFAIESGPGSIVLVRGSGEISP